MSTLQEKLPPTLRDTSPVANGIALTRDPLAFFQRLAHEAGGFAYYVLSDRIVYFINDPRLVREILLVRESDFAKWAFNDSFRLVFGTGLIGSHGELQRKMRKAAQPPLQLGVIPRYAKVIVDLTQRMQNNWSNGAVDLTGEMAMLTVQIVIQALFSISLGEERTRRVCDATFALLRLNTKLGGSPEDVAGFKEANDIISDVADQLAREGENAPNDSGNLLSLFIEANRAGVISSEQLRQEIRTVLLAGHVTTAQSIASTLWLLARHPEIQAQVQAEVDRVLAGETPRAEHAAQLQLCEMVVLEILRMYPPVWVFGREALRQVEIDGLTIKQGQELVICSWLLHHNPEFFPEPARFDPLRWQKDLRSRLPRGVYLPFSTGARNCLGEHFAMLEMILVLASLTQQWTFRELPGSPDPGWSAQLLYWPRRGIKLEAERRA